MDNSYLSPTQNMVGGLIWTVVCAIWVGYFLYKVYKKESDDGDA